MRSPADRPAARWQGRKLPTAVDVVPGWRSRHCFPDIRGCPEVELASPLETWPERWSDGGGHGLENRHRGRHSRGWICCKAHRQAGAHRTSCASSDTSGLLVKIVSSKKKCREEIPRPASRDVTTRVSLVSTHQPLVVLSPFPRDFLALLLVFSTRCILSNWKRSDKGAAVAAAPH